MIMTATVYSGKIYVTAAGVGARSLMALARYLSISEAECRGVH